VEQDNARVMETYLAASKNTLADRMGITILEASAERVVGTMPVAGNIQPYGLLHGGASCVLAETLGSLGSALHGGPDRVTVGIEINATHHRAATTGEVTGVATLLHGGRTVTTYEIVISDAAGRRVCTSRLTCLLIDRVPGRPPIVHRSRVNRGPLTRHSTGAPRHHQGKPHEAGCLRHSVQGIQMSLRRRADARYGGTKGPGPTE
jgi:1,4-dihydroxy-2-naphthoyl-CoA hydrolase